MKQTRLKKGLTNDEKVQKILLKGLDDRIDIAIRRKEILLNSMVEINNEIEQLTYERRMMKKIKFTTIWTIIIHWLRKIKPSV